MGAPQTNADSSEAERPVHRVTLCQRHEHEDAHRWPEMLEIR